MLRPCVRFKKWGLMFLIMGIIFVPKQKMRGLKMHFLFRALFQLTFALFFVKAKGLFGGWPYRATQTTFMSQTKRSSKPSPKKHILKIGSCLPKSTSNFKDYRVEFVGWGMAKEILQAKFTMTW